MQRRTVLAAAVLLAATACKQQTGSGVLEQPSRQAAATPGATAPQQGKLWNAADFRTEDGKLTALQKALAGMALNVCNQHYDEEVITANLNTLMQVFRDSGKDWPYIREAALHLVVYGAFPKVLQTTQRLRRALGGDRLKSVNDLGPNSGLVKDPENFVTADGVTGWLRGLDPEFGDITVRVAGEVWNRPGPSQIERSIITVASDVCNQVIGLPGGNVHDSPGSAHVGFALQGGMTKAQVRELVLFTGKLLPDNEQYKFVKALKVLDATLPFKGPKGEALDRAQ